MNLKNIWNLGIKELRGLLRDPIMLLLIARLASGAAVAAGRVVTIALVRDCYSGRAMARVMSLAFIFFMAAPVLAPSFGELVLVFASWPLSRMIEERRKRRS